MQVKKGGKRADIPDLKDLINGRYSMGSKDGFYKNISELLGEYQDDNLECMMICYRRKMEGSTRTYFINAGNPHMFMTLVRLEHNIMGLYSLEAQHIIDYGEED